MQTVQLGQSDLRVTPICLGTMTFGEQVDEATAHAILDRSLERGVNFLDTAEMYAVPARAETFGATETIIGNWFAKHPGAREKLVLATKVAGPSRGMPWVREGGGLTAKDIAASCEGSLRRLKTDVIDLYQIHWPERNVPVFGQMYYDPTKERTQTSLHEQLEALAQLVKQGKVRHIGLSNETPYGVHEFVRLAEQHGLPRIATVQNVYCLLSRGLENGLDETMHRLGVSLLAYSPLGFGLLTGKYDEPGIDGPGTPRNARIGKYETVRKQRWGRPEAPGRRAPLQRPGARQRHDAHPDGAGMVLHEVAGGQHDHRRDHPGAARGRPGCLGHPALRGNAGGNRPDPLGHQGPGDLKGMARKDHVSETPATALLKASGVAFTEHPYEYLEHGGAQHSAQELGFDPFTVVKTLVMEDEKARPLIVLMHGNRKVSTKNLARQIGAKTVEPCKPEVANRHSGYLVGGTSPFGTRKAMPVYIEQTILSLPWIAINGGRRGYLVGIAPQVCVDLLGAKPVNCALAE